MTIANRIVGFLQNQTQGIDDDELAKVLGLAARQQANSRCRQLEKEGFVIRRAVQGKIHNFWAGKQYSAKLGAPYEPRQLDSDSEPWFWEGNVQAQLVQHLAANGYRILSVADTATRQRGKDIVAEHNGKQLWVSVKGYPKGTPKTKPAVQAAHWFKQAIFDVLVYRQQSTDVDLGVAFPDYKRYRSLAEQVAWLRPVAAFGYFRIQPTGQIFTE